MEMAANNLSLRKYHKEIRGLLPCSQKIKKEILSQIDQSVISFLQENPDADYSQIVARFGTPQSIAATYVENIGTADILRSLRIRKRVVMIIITTVLIILLSWASIVTAELVHQGKLADGNLDVTTQEKIGPV